MSSAPLLRPRELTGSDAAALAELSARLGSGETPSRWAALLMRPGAVGVGVIDGGRMVGYAAGELRGGFGMIGSVAWLEAFGVAVDQRGAGVGRLLLADLLERFARGGAAHVYTLVPVHDQVLAPFFRQVGFKSEPFECLGRTL